LVRSGTASSRKTPRTPNHTGLRSVSLRLRSIAVGQPRFTIRCLAKARRSSSHRSPELKNLKRSCEQTFTLESLPDATTNELTAALSSTTAPDYVAVYDVGQGKLQRYLRLGRADPLFRFRRSILQNSFTFRHPLADGALPIRHRSCCPTGIGTTGRPKRGDPRVRNMSWIAPSTDDRSDSRRVCREPPQPPHFPRRLTKYTAGPVAIERCTGAGRTQRTRPNS